MWTGPSYIAQIFLSNADRSALLTEKLSTGKDTQGRIEIYKDWLHKITWDAVSVSLLYSRVAPPPKSKCCNKKDRDSREPPSFSVGLDPVW